MNSSGMGLKKTTKKLTERRWRSREVLEAPRHAAPKAQARLGGPGACPPGKFLKSRCKSVQSGAFWAMIFAFL